MRYKPFWPGDEVISIVDYDGIPSGTIGRVISRWRGTGYVVRLPDGDFRWLSDRDITSIDPARHRLEEGDIGVVTSDVFQSFAEAGDTYRVHKVAYDIDYYGVSVNGETVWFGGFQLAKYI